MKALKCARVEESEASFSYEMTILMSDPFAELCVKSLMGIGHLF